VSDMEFGVRITADSTGLVGAVQVSENAVQQLGAQTAASGASAQRANVSFNELRASIERLASMSDLAARRATLLKQAQDRASVSSSGLARAAVQNVRVSRQMQLGLQQAGFQVADFAVQVGAGQSAILAFTQQGTQLLQFFGPWGSILGAAGAVLGALAIGFMAAGESADEAADQVESFGDVIEDLEKRIRSANQARLDISGQILAIGAADIDRLKQDLSELEAQRERFIEQSDPFTVRTDQDDDFGAEFAARRRRVLEQAAQQTPEIVELDGQIAQLRDTITTLQLEETTNAFQDLTGELDPATAAWRRYEEQLGLINLAVERGVDGAAALEDQLRAAARADLDASLERLNSQDRESDRRTDPFARAVNSLEDRTRLLTAQADAFSEGADALEKLRVETQLLTAAQAAGIPITEDLRTEIALQAEGYVRASARLKELQEAEKQLQREAQLTARRHDAAVADIERQLLGILPPYEAAVLAAERWREEALENLDETAAGYEEFAADVERIFQERLKDAQEEHLRSSREWSDGARRALRDYADEATDAAANVENAITSGLQTMEDALVDFVTTGKLNFKDLVDSILQDLARLFIRQNVTGPLAQALGGAFGGAGGDGGIGSPVDVRDLLPELGGFGEFPSFDGGGIFGETARPTQRLPLSMLAGAPSFGGGGIFDPDAGPAILHRKEGVFTPQQMDNADHLIRAVMNQRRGTVISDGAIRNSNYYDFRNADASTVAQLRAEAERIENEAVSKSIAAIRGLVLEGGDYSKDMTRGI